MNLKSSLWQFIKDGLVSILVILITFAIAIVADIFVFQRYTAGRYFDIDWSIFIPSIFFFPNPIISPMSFVFLTGFISMGIGGRFLENITSRWSWTKPILIIAVIAWTLGVLLSLILFIKFDFFDWRVLGVNLGITAVSAGAGFIIAGLAGVIFNPTRRLFRIMIGAIASTFVAYPVGFWIAVFSSHYSN